MVYIIRTSACTVKRHDKKSYEILEMPANLKAFSLFALGYPNERKLHADRFEAERVHYVR